MDNPEKNERDPTASCGPDCACNTKTKEFSRLKIILLAIIIIVAGAALGQSLIRKAHAATVPSPTGYSASLSLNPPQEKKQSDPSQPEAFIPLESISSLNTVAQDMGGVFVLLVDNDAGKTPAIVKEISVARDAIASRGMRIGLFQLNRNSQDFAMASSQLKPPGVLVLVKGKGMRGVRGDEITQRNLLQAFMAAMQPSGCCASGSGGSCK